jgi:hypothetical protein
MTAVGINQISATSTFSPKPHSSLPSVAAPAHQ